MHKNTKNGYIKIETKLENNKFYCAVEGSDSGMPESIKNYYLRLHKNFKTDKLSIQNYGLGLHMALSF